MPDNRNMIGCQVFHQADLPEDWSCEPLGNRIRLRYGVGLTEESRIEGAYNVYGSNGVVGTHNEALVEAPGILVGRKGSVGAVHYAEEPFFPIDTVYFVERLRDDSFRYLYYLLDYLNLSRLNAATGVPGLTRKDALSMRGAFPQPDEQAAIAETLDTVDEAIKRTRTTLEKARRLKRGILQKAFSSEHARVEKLKTFVTDIRYGTSQASNDKRWGYPTLRIPNIIGGTINASDLTYVDASAADAKRYLLKEDDILLVRTNGNPAYIGRSAVFSPPDEKEWLYASYLIRVRFNDNLYARYIDEYLKSERGRRELMKRVTTSAGNYNINTKSILTIPFPYQDKTEQAETIALTDTANVQISRFENELTALEKLKKGLMQDLLTGKVRVKQLAAAESASD